MGRVCRDSRVSTKTSKVLVRASKAYLGSKALVRISRACREDLVSKMAHHQVWSVRSTAPKWNRYNACLSEHMSILEQHAPLFITPHAKADAMRMSNSVELLSANATSPPLIHKNKQWNVWE